MARLSAELASSREAAEGLRRDLHVAQADGEGRDRQHDASTRDLRKELRDCDETIGCVRMHSPVSDISLGIAPNRAVAPIGFLTLVCASCLSYAQWPSPATARRGGGCCSQHFSGCSQCCSYC